MTMSKKIYIYPSIEVMDVLTSDMMSFTDASNQTPEEAGGGSSSAPARRGDVF